MSTPTNADGRTTNKIFAVAFITMFLDLLGFGLIIPIQPFYAESFGASPTVVTWLGGAYSLMQFIFIPVWGRVSDRVGRRPVILASVLASSIGHMLFGLAGSLTALFVARLLTGFGNANIATVQALIADSTTGSQRTKGMGLVGAAFGLGFVVGPAVGGYLVRWGLPAPAYVASAMALVNFVLAFFILPETNTYRQQAGETTNPRLRGRELLNLTRRLPNVWTITMLMLLWTFGMSVFQQALSLFIEHVWVSIPADMMAEAQRVGQDAVDALKNTYYQRAAGYTATVMVVTGITAMIIQGGLIGRLAERFGEHLLLRIGLPSIGIGIAIVILAGHTEILALLYPAAVVMAIGTGLTSPVLMSLLSNASPAQVQGSVLGVGQSASSLGRVLGPAVSGILFQINIDLPAMAGIVAVAVGLGVSLMLTESVASPDAVYAETQQ